MTKGDFFKAITPYNYSNTVNEDFFETYDSIIFRIIDANQDGKVSFAEYMFFVVLLSVSDN